MQGLNVIKVQNAEAAHQRLTLLDTHEKLVEAVVENPSDENRNNLRQFVLTKLR